MKISKYIFKFRESRKKTLTLLILIVIITYYPILTNGFLFYWDDQWMVMNDYTAGGWSFYNLKRICTDFYNGQYSPLNQLIYLII